MFWRRNNLESREINKVGLIYNGKSATIIKSIIENSNCMLVFVPKRNKAKSFFQECLKHRNEKGIYEPSLLELEEQSANMEDYVFIHKDDYEEYLKFKENNKKLVVDPKQKELIKERYKELKSQRAVAKEFNLSLSSINRILNDKY